MQSYYLPREYKGEGKILYIFSTKSLIYTGIGVIIGFLINLLFETLGIKKALIPLILIFGGIGYAIGTLKIPESNNFEITRKAGGEKIDDVIIRWFKFKMKHGKIYLYKESHIPLIPKKEGTKDE
jgi:uncharacterized membrane protein